jgi:hypothetical protein
MNSSCRLIWSAIHNIINTRTYTFPVLIPSKTKTKSFKGSVMHRSPLPKSAKNGDGIRMKFKTDMQMRGELMVTQAADAT